MFRIQIKNIFFFFAFILLIPLSLNAKRIVVKSAAEISAAMLTALPGDTLVYTNGTYANQKIIFRGNGTAAKNIFLIAETPGQVILSGNSTLKIAGSYLTVDGFQFQNGYSTANNAVIEFRYDSSNPSSYCRLTNTSIVDYNPADTKTDYKWISLYGQYNRVDHCYLKGKTHLGTTLVVWLSDKPNYHLIDNNYFGPRPAYPENGAETIRVGTSDWSMYDSFTTVEYNYFEECNGETEIISSKSCGNIYRYNTFKECQGTLTLRHGNRCTVEGNFFLCGGKTNSGGIRIIGEDHKVFNNYIENSYGDSYKSAITLMNGVSNSPLNRYYQVKRAIVAYNTVVNSRYSLLIGAGKDSELTLPPLDCKLVNNIFYSAQSSLVTFTDSPINMTWSGNIFYGTSIGMALPANNYNDDPKLSRGLDNLYHLISSSPAIDRSDMAHLSITKDMDGQQRIGVSDAGSDEYSQNPATIKPRTKNDSGPAWMQSATSIAAEDVIPFNFYLGQNYPNPFNPVTTINYELSEDAEITLKVFDILGREVSELITGRYPSGKYSVKFDAGKLSNGVYLFQLSNGKQNSIRKGILLK